MNDNLSRLFKINESDAEKTMYVLKVVLACDTNTASEREQRAYRRLTSMECVLSRVIINDFTSCHDLFNIDHPAWQLGIDITTGGPNVPDETSTHVCLPEQLIYNGHYVRSRRGQSYKCSVCGQAWNLINDQFTEDHQLGVDLDHVG